MQMKMIKTTILTVSLLAALAVPAFAQTKIATVEMPKLFKNYYKTKQAEAVLDQSKADAAKEIKGMSDDFTKAQADYKALLEQANDQAISAEERDKRKQSAADKRKELENSAAAIEQFKRQAQTRIADQSQRMSANLVADIQKFVAAKAKAGGYTLVLNAGTTDVVVYNSGEVDLTDAVLKDLNAGAPVDIGIPSMISTNRP